MDRSKWDVLEIEVKIKVEDPLKVREKILELGATLAKERHFETNTLFDFPSASLFSKKQALRLRTAGKKYYLTFKGTPRKSRKFKIREEYETELKNGKDGEKILQNLGLQPTLSYSKHRTTFRHRKLKLCLDETAAGVFLELEGKQSDIVRFAGSLGYSKKEFIKEDYILLLSKTGGLTKD